MSNTLDQIRALARQRLAEIETEAATLRALLNGAPASGWIAAHGDRLTDRVVAFVAANPGARMGDIREATGHVNDQSLRNTVLNMVKAGRLRREGGRHAMRYFAAFGVAPTGEMVEVEQ